MRFLDNSRLRRTLKSFYPDLYKLKQKVEWHRQYNGNFKRLVSFVEKLNRNYANQLANLGSSERRIPGPSIRKAFKSFDLFAEYPGD